MNNFSSKTTGPKTCCFLAYWPSAVSYWHGLASSSTIFPVCSPQKLLRQFFMSADVITLRCGRTCERLLLRNYKAQIVYLSSLKNCSRHADLFVRLFATAIISEVPPTLRMKILTLYHNFLSDYCRDFSHILHTCTRPQVLLIK